MPQHCGHCGMLSDEGDWGAVSYGLYWRSFGVSLPGDNSFPWQVGNTTVTTWTEYYQELGTVTMFICSSCIGRRCSHLSRILLRLGLGGALLASVAYLFLFMSGLFGYKALDRHEWPLLDQLRWLPFGAVICLFGALWARRENAWESKSTFGQEHLLAEITWDHANPKRFLSDRGPLDIAHVSDIDRKRREFIDAKSEWEAPSKLYAKYLTGEDRTAVLHSSQRPPI